MSEKMTTSDMKVIPQGQTEAEFTAQEVQRASQQAVTREEAKARMMKTQNDVATRQFAAEIQKRAEMQQPSFMPDEVEKLGLVTKVKPAKVDEFQTDMADNTIELIRNLLSEIQYRGLHLKSSPETAAFYQYIAKATEQLELCEVSMTVKGK